MKLPPFDRHLGVRVEQRGDGESVATLRLRPEHLNNRGVAHGGVVSSLLDTALGAAVIGSIPKEWWCATTSLSVQFVDGAGEGRLTATGRVVRRGARVAFARGEIRDDGGRLLAVAQGSWNLWPYRPGQHPEPPGSFVVMRESGERIRVGKILCIGRNFARHIAEMGADKASPPVLFLKPASAIVHDGAQVRIPPEAGRVDHEIELVAVIGKRCQAVDESVALDHVLGYAVGLDMTLRDRQARAKRRGEPWADAKGFDTSAPVSHVAPRHEVGDGAGLALTLEKNGVVVQDGNTADMLHSVAALVALASHRMMLERGDLLFTGTPAGVGPVEPGDVLDARIDKVGSLRVEIVGE
jgi:uncharacterized protein (TIGR00369 family)